MPADNSEDNMSVDINTDNMPIGNSVDNMPVNNGVDNMPVNNSADNIPVLIVRIMCHLILAQIILLRKKSPDEHHLRIWIEKYLEIHFLLHIIH